MGCDVDEAGAPEGLVQRDRRGRAIYTSSLMRPLVFPPPMPTKDLPEHVRRAMRAFERVHMMLEKKNASVGRAKAKRPRRAA